MEPAVAVAAVDAAITLIERLAPMVQAAIQKGEISPDVQLQLDARIQALRSGGNAFAGPEWQPSK